MLLQAPVYQDSRTIIAEADRMFDFKGLTPVLFGQVGNSFPVNRSRTWRSLKIILGEIYDENQKNDENSSRYDS